MSKCARSLVIPAELRRILFLKVLLAAYPRCKVLVGLRVWERGDDFKAICLSMVIPVFKLLFSQLKSEVKETALWGEQS